MTRSSESDAIGTPDHRPDFNLLALMRAYGPEQVAFGQHPESGYVGIIAVHSTRLGPAVGGTRFWQYSTLEEAFIDVLRLSRGMTYKNAIHGLPLGGGKSVILGDSRMAEREGLFRAHGRMVNTLGGRYICAEDVGTTPTDMALIRLETSHVIGLPGLGGDPSPWTALGVFRAIQAAAHYRWGKTDLRGRTVLLQGCGNVGFHLARQLHAAGARLVVTDVDPARGGLLAEQFDARVVAPAAIYDEPADVFAPCALGAILTDSTIARIQVEIVAGAANNQLSQPRHGDSLAARGILYVPDYVANGGGVISGYCEMVRRGDEDVRGLVDGIFATVLNVFAEAEQSRLPPYLAADRIAERKLAAGVAPATAVGPLGRIGTTDQGETKTARVTP